MEITDPKKLTPETRQKIEEAAAMDCTMEEIAFYANISKQTLYNWMESDKKFKERLDELRTNPVLKARRTIVDKLDNAEHAKWYLERKRKTEFSQKIETDITSKGEQINVLDPKYTELAKKFEAQLKQDEE